MEKVLNVKGMGCSGCVNTVEQAIQTLDGVESVKVDLQNATAKVVYQNEKINDRDFERVIEEAGYKMEGVQ